MSDNIDRLAEVAMHSLRQSQAAMWEEPNLDATIVYFSHVEGDYSHVTLDGQYDLRKMVADILANLSCARAV